MHIRSLVVALAVLGCLTNISTVIAQQSNIELLGIELLGLARLSGEARDLSGLGGTLETNTPVDQLGGFSAIDYSGTGNRYLVLSDRGPGDGAASFPCRIHEFDLLIDLKNKSIQPKLLKTILLKNAAGRQLTGSLQAVGTFPNRGIEGLALSVDGTRLIASMQGPLIQDGVVEGEKCLGLNTRWLVLDSQNSDGALSKQLVYPLTDESTGVSEVLAVDSDRFLVLERDSKLGAEATIKHIYLVDVRGATDVSGIASLTRCDLPLGIKAISKTLLIDLRDERFGLGGNATAEKPEGICWGPNLADGRRMLVVCVDNDFEMERQSEFYAFAIAL